MRYVRFTANPLSSTVINGVIDLRLPFNLRGKEMHVLWADGHYLAIPDEEAGEFFGQADFAWSEPDENIDPYRYWQDTVPADTSQIPDWKTFLRDPDPQAAAMPSPPVPSVVNPG